MNKKFLSAILFGALVATTGSFVSCADDSSDVNGLQEQIDALSAQFNKQIATLQVELNAALDAAKAAQNAADQAVAEAKAQNIQEVMDQLEAYIAEQGFATSEELSKIAAKLEALNLNELEVKISDLEAKLAALDLQNDVLDAYSNLVGQVGENAGAISDLQNQIAVLSALIANNDTADLAAKLEALQAAINAMNPSLNVIGAGVSSIVFNPDLYMDGIEAQEYIYLVYRPFVPKSVKNQGPFREYDDEYVTLPDSPFGSYVQKADAEEIAAVMNGYNAEWLWETSTEYVGNFYRNTDVINEVNYYVNPANANIALEDLALQGKDVMLVTRATPASTIGYNVDYADYIKAHNINAEYGKGFAAEVEQQANQKVLKVTVPYTASKAYEAGLEYARYNGNTYYNALVGGVQDAVSYEIVPVVANLTTTWNSNVWAGASKIQGVNRKGSVYCHDLDEQDHEFGGHQNTECQGNNGHVDNGCENGPSDDLHDYDWGTESCDEGKSNVFQLQAKVTDDTEAVVSDFAMLYASPITPIAISFTNQPNVDGHPVLAANKALDCAKDLHLFRTMQEAIEQPASFNVYYYNDQIDLKEYLEVHVNRYSKIAAHSGFHNKWGYHQIERYGLKWNYELVDWNKGDNAFDPTYAHESQFADPELAKQGILKPRKINANGSTNVSVNTTKSDYDIIGKEPIMKVTVTDTNNNDAVVLIGFVKYTIVERLENLDMGVIHTFDHTINCQNYVTCAEFYTKWNEFQFHVLDEATSLSYVEFCSLYKLDVDPATGYAYQFDASNLNNNLGTDDHLDVCPRKAGTHGVVTELLNHPEVGDNDNGLMWQLTACELRNIYWNTPNHSAEVIVRYVRRNELHSTKDPIYVHIKVVVDHKFNAVATIKEKIKNYWHVVEMAEKDDVLNSSELDVNSHPLPVKKDNLISYAQWNMITKPGAPVVDYYQAAYGVRANVQEPTSGSDTRHFFYSITSAWLDNKIEFTGALDGSKNPYDWKSGRIPTAANEDGDGSQLYFHPANNAVKIKSVNFAGRTYYLTVDHTEINVGCSCNNCCLTDAYTGNPCANPSHPYVGHSATDGHMDSHNAHNPHCAANVCPEKVTGSTPKEYIENLRTLETNYNILPTEGTVYSNDTIWVGLTPGAKSEILAILYKAGEDAGCVDPTSHDVPHIEYQHGQLAQDLLNEFEHSAAQEFVYVGIYGMQNVNGCKQYVAPVADNVYPVHFLRPIQSLDYETENLEDAHCNGSLFWIADIFVDKLYDWREVYFWPNHIWYYAYYEVDHITLDFENTLTDLHHPGTFEKLVNVSTEVKFYHKDRNKNVMGYVQDRHANNLSGLAIRYGASDPQEIPTLSWVETANQVELAEELRYKFGYLEYNNNRGNVEDFDIIVPVTLHYYWGNVATFNVKVHVDGSIGNDSNPVED